MTVGVGAWVKRRGPQWLLAVLALATAALIVIGDIDATKALIALALVALAAVLLVATQDQLRAIGRRVGEVGIGPATVKFAEDARIAAGEAEPDDDVEAAEGAGGLIELRLKLEQKLAYIATHLLASRRDDVNREPIPTYVTVGSLESENLITKEQARTLARLLTVSEREFSRLPKDLAEQIVGDGRKVVASLRLTVFRNHVKQELVRGDWSVTSVMKIEGRSVLVVAHDEGSENKRLVMPVFAMGRSTQRIRNAGDRLERSGQRAAAFIVVPDDWRGDIGEDFGVSVARGVRDLAVKLRQSVADDAPRSPSGVGAANVATASDR